MHLDPVHQYFQRGLDFRSALACGRTDFKDKFREHYYLVCVDGELQPHDS
jgi:hypothetical protein